MVKDEGFEVVFSEAFRRSFEQVASVRHGQMELPMQRGERERD